MSTEQSSDRSIPINFEMETPKRKFFVRLISFIAGIYTGICTGIFIVILYLFLIGRSAERLIVLLGVLVVVLVVVLVAIRQFLPSSLYDDSNEENTAPMDRAMIRRIVREAMEGLEDLLTPDLIGDYNEAIHTHGELNGNRLMLSKLLLEIKIRKEKKRFTGGIRKLYYNLINDLEIDIRGKPYLHHELIFDPAVQIKRNMGFDQSTNSTVAITADTTVEQLEYILREQEIED